MDMDETHKEDQTNIEAHDWLSANMSVNPFHYQLGDQALQKNLGSIPWPEEQYLWVPKANGISKTEMSTHSKCLDAALEKVQWQQKGISQGQGNYGPSQEIGRDFGHSHHRHSSSTAGITTFTLLPAQPLVVQQDMAGTHPPITGDEDRTNVVAGQGLFYENNNTTHAGNNTQNYHHHRCLLFVWGIASQYGNAHGTWMGSDGLQSINYKELKTILLALQYLLVHV
ncbi:hypothetical protein IWQ61_006317 [Dispira simplex]|nr:hypothetical protein IWQ61_006317 [Dispira simplex]